MSLTARVATGATLWAVGLLAWDHLWGNEPASEPFPVDPGAFVLTVVLVLTAAALVFGRTVPRAAQRPATLHRSALAHAVVAVLLAPVAAWLGFPVVVAGGGIALGLRARAGEHRWLATAAVALGVVAVAVATLATAFPATADE